MKINEIATGVAIAAGGVLLAGYIMSEFRNVAIINTVHNGYDS